MSEQPPDDDGADLAAQFFKSVQDRNISFEGDEIEFADAEEEEMENASDGGNNNASEEQDDDDDAILREYDVSSEGSLTDGQIYDEMKDRVLESAGAFLELTKGAEDGSEGQESGASKVYKPPTNIPDSGLTAGEVVELVLSALRNNDVPSPDYGVQILFGYSSPESQIVEQIETDGLTPSQYRTFLCMTEDNMALFEHATAVIDRADYSPDSLKGYFTARLMNGGGSSKDDVTVNFILSMTGTNEDDCWLIDSMLIRPSKLRRRRRR